MDGYANIAGRILNTNKIKIVILKRFKLYCKFKSFLHENNLKEANFEFNNRKYY